MTQQVGQAAEAGQRTAARRGRLPPPDGSALLFLAGSAWAALAMVAWWLVLAGALALPGPLGALDWHVHELLYGFVPAIAVGYMLSMVANWTGRLPVTGRPRTALLAVWLAGRIALLVLPPGWIVLAAAIDAAFLAVAFALIAREVVRGRDRRSARVLLPLALLAGGNGLFLWQAATGVGAASGAGTRLGIAGTVLLLSIVGGALVPSFTRGWLSQNRQPAPPPGWPALDTAATAAAGVALLAWTLAPHARPTGVLLVAAGAVHLVRWLRWQGWRARREPLVAALQVGYGFVPAGFLLTGLAAAAPELGWPAHGEAIHAWTAGSIGITMLAMMMRVALRRARLDVRADALLAGLLAAAVGAAATRSFVGVDTGVMLGVAAACWAIAFGGYALRFGRSLAAPPPERRPRAGKP